MPREREAVYLDFIVLGGDARMPALAKLLRQQGHTARHLQRPTADAANVVVNCPVGGNLEVLDDIPADTRVFTCGPGHCDDPRVIDLWKDEALQLDNAWLTAEGALCAAMQAGQRSIRETRALVIGWVSNHIVEPRLGKYEGDADTSGVQDLTPEQKLGLKRAGLGSLVFIAVILVLYFWGPLGLTKSGARKFIGSAFLNGLIPILFFFFAVPGILYGYTVGTFKSSADINKAMVRQTAAVGSFVVLCFFAGQFQGLFNWTKLGTILAIEGANFLKGIGFTGIPMCVCFIFVAGCINILISSSAAKWAILAPLFVPMFMLMGYHPGFTQLLYRLGDSPSNCISPLSAYVWMMLSVVQAKYNKDAHIGIMLSNLVPYFVALQIIWVTFFIIWAYAGLPIGPGVTMQMPAGILP